MRFSIKNSSQIIRKLGPVVYIVGAQWGDEGKGKLVDILSEKYDIVARSAGGANAGHTIWVNRKGKSEKFIFHLIPSGILHDKKICLLGHGMVIHIPTLLEEIQALREQGIEVKNKLLISDRAHLVFSYHKIIDDIQEERSGGKVGTTKRGIGPAYMDKAARIGLRIGDIKHFDGFARQLRQNAERHMKMYGFKFDIESEINYYRDVSEMFEPYITNAIAYLHKERAKGKTILIEGAQGTNLDVDMGTYPYVTSSSTTSGGACTGLGIAPNAITSAIGIAKAYTTRVGGGPFPTELGDIEGNMLREQGNEYGATTGRPRRCGWFDAVVVRHAIQVNGIRSICLTKLDILSGFKNLKIATGYSLDGEQIDFVPSSVNDLERIQVAYEEMPGWQKPLKDIKAFKELPAQAQKYILRLEELLKTSINFIGVGLHRDEIVYH